MVETRINPPCFRAATRRSTPALRNSEVRTKSEHISDNESVFKIKKDPRMGEQDNENMLERRVNTKSSISSDANGRANTMDRRRTPEEYKYDTSGFKEFGGALGTSMAMIFFPLLMWYLWIGQVHYNASLPLPEKGETLQQFALKLVGYVLEVCTLYLAVILNWLIPEIRGRGQHGKHGQSTGRTSSGKQFFT